MKSHAEHSIMVRHWNAKGRPLMFGEEGTKEEGTCHRLRSPHNGYLVEVRFTELPNLPDEMIVRSTNWRAEHEPHGIYKKADCQKFYRELKRAGFVSKKD